MQHERFLWIIYEADIFLEVSPTRYLKESLQAVLHANVLYRVKKGSSDQKWW